jgi:hypothetical protein
MEAVTGHDFEALHASQRGNSSLLPVCCSDSFSLWTRGGLLKDLVGNLMQQCQTVDADLRSLSLLVVPDAAANSWVLPYVDGDGPFLPGTVSVFQPARTCGGTDGYLTRYTHHGEQSAHRWQKARCSKITARCERLGSQLALPNPTGPLTRQHMARGISGQYSGSPRRSLESLSWARAFGAWRRPGVALTGVRRRFMPVYRLGWRLCPRLSADWPSLRRGTSFWLVGAGWSTSNHRGLCRLHPLLSPPAANCQINDVAAACKSLAVILDRNALLMQE